MSFSGNVNFIDKRVYSYIANPYNRLFCPTDLYPFFKLNLIYFFDYMK